MCQINGLEYGFPPVIEGDLEPFDVNSKTTTDPDPKRYFSDHASTILTGSITAYSGTSRHETERTHVFDSSVMCCRVDSRGIVLRVRHGRIVILRVLPLAAFMLLLTPGTARAEPGVSTSHIPVLWSGVFVVTAFVSAIPMLLMRQRKPDKPRWPYLLGSIILALVMIGFIGPIFVAIASILITGRTM